MSARCDDVIICTDRTTMKLLLSNVGKLYGDVGKKLTDYNLPAPKPCFNVRRWHWGWQSPEINRQSSHFGKCRNPWLLRMCYAVIRCVFNINVKCMDNRIAKFCSSILNRGSTNQNLVQIFRDMIECKEFVLSLIKIYRNTPDGVWWAR